MRRGGGGGAASTVFLVDRRGFFTGSASFFTGSGFSLGSLGADARVAFALLAFAAGSAVFFFGLLRVADRLVNHDSYRA